MHPVLLEIPSIGLRLYSYGTCFALGYVVAVLVMARLGRKWQDLPERITYTIVFLAFVGGILGGGSLQVLVEIFARGRSAEEALRATTLAGGIGVYYGGIIASMLMIFAYTRLRGIYWWHAADLLFTVVPLGLAVGRIGCFLGGCCWGRECRLPWAVTFPEKAHAMTGVPAGVPLHPAQLYAVAANLLIFGLVILILRRKSFAGQPTLCYFILYGIARFVLEMFRDDPRGILPFGLSTSQTISIGFILLAVALWPFLRRHGVPESPFYRPSGGRGRRRGGAGRRG